MGSAAETPTLSASHKMFSTFTNYFWGESEEELAQETVPRAQEVEDWIVVGDKPKDFQDSKEKSKKQSQRNNPSSKQRLHSLMFGDGSSSKSGSWNRPRSLETRTKCTN